MRHLFSATAVLCSIVLIFLLGTTAVFAADSPDLESYQGYLQPAPLGVGAEFAWNTPGGTGIGVKYVDVGLGYNTAHEDLPPVFHAYGGHDDFWKGHGSSVLGLIAAVHNDYGMKGIAPDTLVGYEAFGNLSQLPGIAIANAAAAVGPGGIVQVTMELPGPFTPSNCEGVHTNECGYVPGEWNDSVFNAIKAAVASGVIVIEAAGNGTTDLDNPVYAGKFDRTQRDSGAILVTTGSSSGRYPLQWSNTGSRVDVHGWGENVAALGGSVFYGADLWDGGVNASYTALFGGTSAASSMVSGVVASIQGVALNRYGRPIPPLTMRELLVRTGTPQTDELGRKIGSLPDLEAAITQVLDHFPDYVAPEIVLIGDNPYRIIVGENYIEPGFQAVDDVDGDISGSVVVSGTVDTSEAGVYTLYYDVTDAAGNSAVQVSRQVQVSDPQQCQEFVTSVQEHVDAGRAVQVSSGWWWFITTTYKALGSNQNLGSDKGAVVGLFQLGGESDWNVGSCPGPDLIAPVITLIGDNPQLVAQGATYVEPGYEALDNVDGDLTDQVVVTGDVDTSEVGRTFLRSYNVADSSGNEAETVTREVLIVEAASEWEDTISAHVDAGRAYAQRTGWWFWTITTYYATGSNENLGTNAGAIVTLIENPPGSGIYQQK